MPDCVEAVINAKGGHTRFWGGVLPHLLAITVSYFVLYDITVLPYDEYGGLLMSASSLNTLL